MERRDLNTAKMEFTTQKIRQEWEDQKETILGIEGQPPADWQTTSTLSNITDIDEAIVPGKTSVADEILSAMKEDAIVPNSNENGAALKDETKSKKKRRKKSMMKKKTSQRKSSSSSSIGSGQSDAIEAEGDSASLSNNTITGTPSFMDDSPKSETVEQNLAAAIEEKDTTIIEPINKTDGLLPPSTHTTTSRIRDLDIHFFSDTELASGKSPHGSRPQTPIQSDSEYEMSHRDTSADKNNIMTNSASWKWGELPTQLLDTEDAKQAQRNSMLSNMFSFMKQSKKLRKSSSEGVYLSDLDTKDMDPKMMALYFPPVKSSQGATNIGDREDDLESGNGTSLPHSPSSLEEPKSLDSDYEEDKSTDNK